MDAILVDLRTSGNIDLMSALPVADAAVIAVGIGVALRFGTALEE